MTDDSTINIVVIIIIIIINRPWTMSATVIDFGLDKANDNVNYKKCKDYAPGSLRRP